MTKFSKTTKLAMILAAVAALLLYLGSCATEGPAGPAGADGADGTDGTDGVNAAANCTQCHIDDVDMKTKIEQYKYQVHYTGIATDEISSGSCTRCHTDQGFKAWIAAGKPAGSPSYAVVNQMAINCRTCHEIHTTYTSNDYALRQTAAVSFTADSSFVYDGGKGNLCASCHNPRRLAVVTNGDRVTMLGATGAVNTTAYSNTSTTTGPHYGVQTAVVSGQGAYEFTNWNWTSKTNAHYDNLADTCVNCHMGTARGTTAGGHTLHMVHEETGADNVTDCKVCHTTITTFDWKGVQTEIEAKLLALSNMLVASNIMTADNYPTVNRNSFSVSTYFIVTTNVWGSSAAATSWTNMYTNVATGATLSNIATFTTTGDIASVLVKTNQRTVWSAEEMGAFFNYRIILKDGSLGVHNSDYTRRILDSTLYNLTN